MSDVVLSAALRSNLLSLQSTQKMIDKTQQKLATGLKINSALDGAQQFFAAQSLNNRATDLGRLLDGIGQSIRTIEQANNGVTSLSSLINQADSIATQALDAMAELRSSAAFAGTARVSGVTDLTSRAGITAGDTFTVQVGSGETTTVTIGAGQGINSLVSQLNDIENVRAKLDSEGRLTIASTNGESLRLANGVNSITGAASTSLTSATGLGFTNINATVSSGTIALGGAATSASELDADTAFATDDVISLSVNGAPAQTFTVTAASTVGDLMSWANSIEGVNAVLDEATGNIIFSSDNGSTIEFTTDGTPAASSVNASGDGSTAIIGNKLSTTMINDTTGAVAARTAALNTISGFTTLAAGDTIAFDTGSGSFSVTAGQTISDIVDAINVHANNDGLVAAYNDATGELSFTLTGTVSSFSMTTSNAGTATSGFGFGNGVIDASGSTTARFTSSGGAANSRLSELQENYNSVRAQIDQVVADSGYAGVNLLNGVDMTTFFNEGRTSSLVTKGVDFTAAGMGVAEADFSSLESINVSVAQVRDALTTLRNFGNSLSNNLSVIQNRQDFTSQTINTLKAGADDLTLADQNEEGANLLALQTRQQLGVTALSLAAQSQQSVLRLF